MRKLVLLFKKIYLLLLFVVFETAAIAFYAGSTEFTRAELIGAANSVLGWGHKVLADVAGYFSLRGENRRLAGEIASLRERLTAAEYVSGGDTLAVSFALPYRFSSASVVNNSVNRMRNYITVDKGRRDGVRPDMAITTPEGFVVGYVADCSDNFAVGISILNLDFHGSGLLSGDGAYGPVSWDGKSSEYVLLSDIPKYADIHVGDTVFTTSFSAIFPEGMMIGTVEGFRMTESMLYEARVRLAAQMASLNHVLLVDYVAAAERRELEERVVAGK